MTLWRKGEAAPQALPSLDYDHEGQPWSDLANDADGRVACGWSPAPEPPQHNPAVEYAVWSSGAWLIQPLPAPPATPARIVKYWLLQRFTEAQERAFAKLEYLARNLTPTDLDDPQKEGLFQLQRFLRRLDALAVVELDAEQTIAGFELLRLLGVFGDPEAQESIDALSQILAPPQAHEAA